MQLSDGTVIPSYLGTRQRGLPEDTGVFSNTALRLGEVKEVIYPESPRSLSRKYCEYSVEVQHRDGSGPGVSTIYSNCLVANLFGSGADTFRYTLRTDPKKVSSDDGVGPGAKVLILCLNGETARAYIIGGCRDPETEAETLKDKKEDGHNLLWEFNGCRASINKDGELAVMFRGATNHSGDLADGVEAANGESSITFRKNGSIEIVDAAKTQSIVLDHPGKKISCSAASNLETHAPQGTTIDSSGGTVKITSLGTKIGGDAAVDALVMGTKYRAAETTLHSSILTALTTIVGLFASLAAMHAAAGAALAACAPLHFIPIAGPMIGAPFLLTAAASMASMSPIFAAIASALSTVIAALTTFEAGATTYLSVKNTTD